MTTEKSSWPLRVDVLQRGFSYDSASERATAFTGTAASAAGPASAAEKCDGVVSEAQQRGWLTGKGPLMRGWEKQQNA